MSEHCYQNALALQWKSLHGETSQSVMQLLTPQITRETRLQQQDGLSVPVARTNAGKSKYAICAALISPQMMKQFCSQIESLN